MSVEASDPIIGRRVRIHKNQNRIGGDKYPGRYGTVLKRNSIDKTHIYVQLEPTARAKERVETFWLRDLIFLED